MAPVHYRKGSFPPDTRLDWPKLIPLIGPAAANWIGPPGCTVADATFVPIGAQELPRALSHWESYLHENAPDRLVQLAILHAEFEALHPFLDGNGRLGRMLVPLFLWQRGLIREPVFYLSGYFEERRSACYEGLLAVSSDDDWTGLVPAVPGGGALAGGHQTRSRRCVGCSAAPSSVAPTSRRRQDCRRERRIDCFESCSKRAF